ncbi:PREDICTED: di-N-acetylchitobiase-like [Acropora digitifera]|uniref:di-N-acetylchitobiase-like n=1 Tax=Acropora digitifera TaxID=70779 RepID=UPI00077AC2BD|nr:PREDICTED: di-N-acetylchitobiase-like [Acropora digitifera]
MAALLIRVALVVLICFGSSVVGKCPCEDEALCEPISRPPGREFFMFSSKPNVWKKYDWAKVTTIALFRPWDDELMCEAHKKGVRVVLAANFPTEKLGSKELRTKWIKNLTKEALARHADGVNIDIESPIPKRSREVTLLTKLVNETKIAFQSVIKNAQVSFDVAWSPDCVDGRCYDALALSKVVDFLVVMAYDEQSQIKTGECIAKANSPLNQTKYAVGEYLDLGIEPAKLVLGLPWYGYDYPCVDVINGVCFIKKVPFRGVNCSDAAGRQAEYGEIQDLAISRALFNPQFDEESTSYFFDYEDTVGGMHQVWFDDVGSLKPKYEFAANRGLNGVAIWNVDLLDYSDSPRAKLQTKNMWDSLQY